MTGNPLPDIILGLGAAAAAFFLGSRGMWVRGYLSGYQAGMEIGKKIGQLAAEAEAEDDAETLP